MANCLRLHPAPDFRLSKGQDYVFYSTRVQALASTKLNPELFYNVDTGWTPYSQEVFKFLCTVKGNKLPFRIIKWKGFNSER